LRVSTRLVSSKYLRPHPRPYRRRLFEAAVKPVLPEEMPACRSMKEWREAWERKWNDYEEIELALASKVLNELKQKNYRVLALCQLQSVPDRSLWLTRNRWRMKGLDLYKYDGRTMIKVFENTPLSTLNVAIVDDFSCFLMAKHPEAIKTIIQETRNIAWITPLMMCVDSRLLSIDEAISIGAMSNLNEIPTETCNILARIPVDMVNALEYHARLLCSNLDSIAKLRQNEENA